MRERHGRDVISVGFTTYRCCAPLSAGESGRAPREPRLERAIGVIYRPQTERQAPTADP